MARGRKKLAITREELQGVVDQLEAETPFTSRAALWQAVAGTEWAKNLIPRPLTAQVAMLRAKELGVTVKTACGEIGKPREGRDKKSFVLPLKVIEISKRETPSKYHDVLERANAGSRKAAMKLKCLECSGWSQNEVAHCEIYGCALWQFRPYKRTKPNA